MVLRQRIGLEMAKSKKKAAARAPILAAGGIVISGSKKPLIAVVQLTEQKTWVLPKGKLRKKETEIAAAKREAIEETGRNVVVHEYLGRIDYVSGGVPKIAKFWRMEAKGKPRALMRDVQAVQWLPLDQAIKKLSRARERKFLKSFGPRALRLAKPEIRPAPKAPGLFGWLQSLLTGGRR